MNLISSPKLNSYDGIILAVPHNSFIKLGPQQLKEFGKAKHIFYDVKSVFDFKDSDIRL